MKVVTYNIHKGMDKNNKLTLDKIGRYLKVLNCNVICLQEVLYKQYIELKKIINIDGVFVANVKEKLYGICIFTNYKITFNEHILLTSKKEQRGFLNVTILNKEKINIINTHLGLDIEERYIQISEIMDYINKIGGKTILCGDFNQKNIALNTFIDSACCNNSYNMCTFSASNSRIDYIYFNYKVDIKNYLVDNIDLSDHYPVIVDILG